MEMNTVPKRLSADLLAFCSGISTERPIYIPSKPSADAQTSACFDNVGRKIGRAGGSIAYGWAIWHLPSLYFEAEHHGVWRNRQRKLVDVSPQFGGVSKILFLPDMMAVHDPNTFRTNRIAAVSAEPLPTELVALANARNALLDRYRSGRHTTVTLSVSDHLELGKITRRMGALMALANLA